MPRIIAHVSTDVGFLRREPSESVVDSYDEVVTDDTDSHKLFAVSYPPLGKGTTSVGCVCDGWRGK
jgi:hypothetical protein